MDDIKHSLFVKTWISDLRWLEWSLKFLEKNWNVDSELVIGCPGDCTGTIASWDSPLRPRFVEMVDWPDLGYLSQQYYKMVSDLYCHGDLISFIDSDSMLFKPTSINDITRNGKPIVWYTPYSDLGTTVPWKAIVNDVLMMEPQLEFMRCHPFTYRRSTLAAARALLEKLHRKSLHDLIRERPGHSFSEFNVIGFYAWVFERDQYAFTHTNEMGDWTRVRQFWSYGDWTEDAPRYLQGLLDSCK